MRETNGLAHLDRCEPVPRSCNLAEARTSKVKRTGWLEWMGADDLRSPVIGAIESQHHVSTAHRLHCGINVSQNSGPINHLKAQGLSGPMLKMLPVGFWDARQRHQKQTDLRHSVAAET
ncbi:hypothetical protein EYF80_021090 [Liparis tanakae]|uniref:Uncharacterized protein n=1 Tax=Liparis tanakae TaxID=230148 RepID=A0A4Z2HT05_9TELE|nr:hypothetical protein EYF80_021090 [Liparis tanakae]